MQQAVERWKVPWYCFRLSDVSFDTRTLMGNAADTVMLVLWASQLAGVAVTESTVDLQCIPVDFAARAMVAVARERRLGGRVFHLTGAGPVFGAWLEALARAGDLARVAPSQWVARVQQRLSLPDTPQLLTRAAPLLQQVQFLSPASPLTAIPTERTRAALQALLPDHPWPPAPALTPPDVLALLANTYAHLLQ